MDFKPPHYTTLLHYVQIPYLDRGRLHTLEKWGVMADSRPPPAEHGERPLLRNREGAVRCLSCLLDCGCPDRWQFEI
jgi:hypothetical protein